MLLKTEKVKRDERKEQKNAKPRKLPEQDKVTYVKEKVSDQQIHIFTHIAKERNKKMSKKHNLKVREGKTQERKVRQMSENT